MKADNYPHTTKDSKGNVIHYKDSTEFESWSEFDEKGNVIYYKTSYGLESWRVYNERNNEIHYKNSDGFEYWQEYDERDNRIYFKNSDGIEYWYDSKGYKIPNPNLTVELTLEDIAEKFNIDVKNIKIKK